MSALRVDPETVIAVIAAAILVVVLVREIRWNKRRDAQDAENADAHQRQVATDKNLDRIYSEPGAVWDDAGPVFQPSYASTTPPAEAVSPLPNVDEACARIATLHIPLAEHGLGPDPRFLVPELIAVLPNPNATTFPEEPTVKPIMPAPPAAADAAPFAAPPAKPYAPEGGTKPIKNTVTPRNAKSNAANKLPKKARHSKPRGMA